MENITYRRRLDIEGDKNRGWQVDIVEACNEVGEVVGYLKLAFIPKNRFNRRYKSILNYLNDMRGHFIFPFNPGGEAVCPELESLSDAELMKAANSISMMLGLGDLTHGFGYGVADPKTGVYRDYDYSVYHDGNTRNDVMERINQMLELVYREYEKDFVRFKQYYVDNAIDDYISVDKDYRRQGIATSLYINAADWCKFRNLKFYLSSCRSNEAELLATHMRTLGMIKTKNRYGRYRIHPIVPDAVT